MRRKYKFRRLERNRIKYPVAVRRKLNDLKALKKVFGRLFILMRSYVIWPSVPARAEWLRLCCGSWCMARTDEPLFAEHMAVEVTWLSLA